MLVLSRKMDESIRIGENVVIKIISMKMGRVRLGIEAPNDVTILRGELPVDAERPPVRTRRAGPKPGEEKVA